VHADPRKTESPLLPCLTINLGRTKTTTVEDRAHAVLIGRAVTALKQWPEGAKIDTGPLFRRIDQWGNIDRRALTPQSVNLMLKTRCKQAGLDPEAFSAHGLRSGYLTEAANRGVPLQEAMQQSLHRSVMQVASYYNNAERKNGRAARSFESTPVAQQGQDFVFELELDPGILRHLVGVMDMTPYGSGRVRRVAEGHGYQISPVPSTRSTTRKVERG